ncbi:hypothetical protein GCWU000246_01555 [Jonquetella anthropi E3_33 E1]|nr:hypothetical protein GCWU000246_01555 [Jonquetella anthropi E3_33 E1]
MITNTPRGRHVLYTNRTEIARETAERRARQALAFEAGTK